MTYEEADNKIKELLDVDFLNKLTEITKLYGWCCDHEEISSFVNELYGFMDMDTPDLSSYELTE